MDNESGGSHEQKQEEGKKGGWRKAETVCYILYLKLNLYAVFWTTYFYRLSKTSSTPITIHNLNDYEMMIAAHLVQPSDINVTWGDIAGLESLVQELRETVILPIQKKELFANSELTTAPKGNFAVM